MTKRFTVTVFYKDGSTLTDTCRTRKQADAKAWYLRNQYYHQIDRIEITQ